MWGQFYPVNEIWTQWQYIDVIILPRRISSREWNLDQTLGAIFFSMD